MAMSYPANAIIGVQIIGTVFTQVCMTERYFRLKTGPMDAAAIAAILNTAWCNNLRQTYTVDWRWTLYKIRQIDPGTPTEYEEWPSSQLSGLAQQHTLPPQLSTLWHLRTSAGLSGRKGRVHHPAASMAYFQNGAFTNAGINSMTSNLNSVKAALAVNGTSALELQIPIYGDGIPQGGDPVTDIILRMQHGVIKSRRIDY